MSIISMALLSNQSDALLKRGMLLSYIVEVIEEVVADLHRLDDGALSSAANVIKALAKQGE